MSKRARTSGLTDMATDTAGLVASFLLRHEVNALLCSHRACLSALFRAHNLSFAHQVDSKALHVPFWLSPMAKHVTSVTLGYDSNLVSPLRRAIEHMALRMPHLRSLDTYTVNTLLFPPMLEHLHVRYTHDVHDRVFEALDATPFLRSLHITGIAHPLRNCLAALAPLAHLTELRFTVNIRKWEDALVLLQCQALRTVQVHHFPNVPPEVRFPWTSFQCTLYPLQIIRALLTSLPYVQTLVLHRFDTARMTALDMVCERITTLELLLIGEPSSSNVCRALGRCTQLTSLCLKDDCDILFDTWELVPCFEQLRHLHTLSLDSFDLDDIDFLAQCTPTLTSLSLKLTRLPVTQDSLHAFTHLTCLRTLCLDRAFHEPLGAGGILFASPVRERVFPQLTHCAVVE